MRRDYIRTDEMIRNAYMRLLFKENPDDITVHSILEEADISRGTFYAHFKDIPDLAGHVMKEMTDSIAKELEGRTLYDLIEDPREPVDHILGIIMERKDMLKAVLSSSDSPKVVRMIKEMFIQALQKKRIADSKMDIVDLIDFCVAGAAFDACLRWLKDDHGVSREKAVETISLFLSGGLAKVYK